MPLNFMIALLIAFLFVILFYFVLKKRSTKVLVLTILLLLGEAVVLVHSIDGLTHAIETGLPSVGTIVEKERDPGIFGKYAPAYYFHVQFVDPFTQTKRTLITAEILKRKYEAFSVGDSVDIFYVQGDDFVYFGVPGDPYIQFWIIVVFMVITALTGMYFYRRYRSGHENES